ncbi:Fc.00g029130.m01.CDS01 [Cosmosporella sp. VM-42]
MNGSTDYFVRKRVAIIGSGCAGIGALWALNRTYHDVYMYEASDRLGGHTNTVQWKTGKYTTAVDTGFSVFNTATYPNFINFLKRVGVETDPTEMTFGLSRDRGAFEWSSSSLRALFCEKRNFFSPRMWRMLFDIIRFNQFALDLLINEEEEPEHPYVGNAMMNGLNKEETIGTYLDREGYSEAFRDDYLLPLAAALWSTSPDRCSLEFPAATLVRFLWNHHLLSTVSSRPEWLTLRDGSKSYIDAVMRGFPPNHLFLKTPVRHVSGESDGRVRVHLENGSSALYDHVIVATHGDQALEIVGPSATAQERSILSCFQTSQNEAVLHSDLSLMPMRKRAWSALNYLAQSSRSKGNKGNFEQVSLTYNMNILQHIPRDTFGDVLVTLNPLYKPRPEKIQGRYYYSSPLYNPSTVRAQKLLRYIQNTRGISYAGAWTKYGFHEDGFGSGLFVAQEHLGARLPFEYKDSTYSRGKKPSLGILDLLLRLVILIIRLFVVQALEKVVVVSRSRVKPVARRVNGVNGNYGKMNGKLT